MTDKQFARVGFLLMGLGACGVTALIGMALWSAGYVGESAGLRWVGAIMAVGGAAGLLAARWGFRRTMVWLQ